MFINSIIVVSLVFPSKPLKCHRGQLKRPNDSCDWAAQLGSNICLYCQNVFIYLFFLLFEYHVALIAYKSMNTNRHTVGYELNNQRVCNPGTGCGCLISVNDTVIAF